MKKPFANISPELQILHDLKPLKRSQNLLKHLKILSEKHHRGISLTKLRGMPERETCYNHENDHLSSDS